MVVNIIGLSADGSEGDEDEQERPASVSGQGEEVVECCGHNQLAPPST